MIVDLPYRFKPRHYQTEVNRAIFVERKKHILQILHRRAGKTIDILNVCIGLSMEEVGLGLYTFPQVNQARRNIWEGVDKTGRKYLDYIPINLIDRLDNQCMSVHLVNGSIIQFCGTDNFDPFRGSNPRYVVYDEYAHQDPSARLALDPILTENDGIEILIYTPHGRNHGYKAYKDALKNPTDWYVGHYNIEQTFKNDGTPVIDKAKIKQRIVNGYPQAMADQEYYCSFDAGVYGSYYATYIEAIRKVDHIKIFDIDPLLPVRTVWDLGISDDMGILFVQNAGPEIRIINYYHNTGQGFSHYGNYLSEFKKLHNIEYIAHYAPHDIKVRELSTGKTRLQCAREVGILFQIVPKLGIADGIDLVRKLFPKLWFHSENCEYLIDSLNDYHKEFDEKNNCFDDTPHHDWTCHGADCTRYLATIWNVLFEAKTTRTPRIRRYK